MCVYNSKMDHSRLFLNKINYIQNCITNKLFSVMFINRTCYNRIENNEFLASFYHIEKADQDEIILKTYP